MKAYRIILLLRSVILFQFNDYWLSNLVVWFIILCHLYCFKVLYRGVDIVMKYLIVEFLLITLSFKDTIVDHLISVFSLKLKKILNSCLINLKFVFLRHFFVINVRHIKFSQILSNEICETYYYVTLLSPLITTLLPRNGCSSRAW